MKPPAPDTKPAPLSATVTPQQNPIPLLAATFDQWTLPTGDLAGSFRSSLPLFPPQGAPLYERHCARLL